MPRRRIFDDMAAADLRARYEAGATMRELAAEHGCGVKAVRNALRQAGTAMRRAPGRTFTVAEAAAGRATNKARALARGREIVRRRLAGEKWVVIAYEFGVSLGSVGSLLPIARRALIADNADAETWARVFPRAAGRHRPAQHKEAA